MKEEKIIIVGGVAGGASAAARLRRLNEFARIILLEKGEHISYANCGLPYYAGGVIEDRDELFLQTPESFFSRFRIDVRTGEEALRIDREKKQAVIRRLSDGTEYREDYDKLILSPGAAPFLPPVKGTDLPAVQTLGSVEDSLKLKEWVKSNPGKHAVVVGGGFIGLEYAENLRHAGLKVTVIEAMPQILPPYDPEIAAILAGELREKGICLKLGAMVEKIEEDQGCRVSLKGGEVIACDRVLLSAGVRPRGGLAEQAGLPVNKRGGIRTNAAMQTEDADIYAVGDAAEIRNFQTGEAAMIPLAGPANKQGRLAADRICGREEEYRGAIGTSVIRLFARTGACTGLNEKTLKEKQIPYHKLYLLPYHHAGYYPGARQMVLKLLFSPEGKVLGAQAVGEAGVEKRIDVIAAAIHFGGTVRDLAELDLCYAPPYGSAKDPVNFAGFAAGNVLDGTSRLWYWDELDRAERENCLLLDVRTEEEYRNGHLPGSRNIPVDELREHLEELPEDKEILVYCQVGIRGYIAQRILTQHGYDARNLSGGYGLLQRIGAVQA